MTATIKPIDTRYAGHLFRSRLEARWAVVLDRMGIEWQYEAEGFELSSGQRYLPDFWLPKLNTFLEIKGTAPTAEEHSKLFDLGEDTGAFTAFGLALDSSAPLKFFLPQDHDSAYPADLPRPTGADIGCLSGIPETENMGEIDCPICCDGSGYAHTGEMVTWENGIPDVCARGPVYTIPVQHECCGHRWDIVLAFHKGNTSLLYRIPNDGNFSPLEWITRSERRAFREALEGGRTARFEHGQTPTT